MAKQGKTLVELAQEIERQRNAKRDFVAPTSKVEVVNNSVAGPGVRLRLDTSAPGRVVDVITPEFAGMELTSLAHGQLAEYVGIPQKYYDRCLLEAPALLADNANHWLRQQPASDKRLVRTLDGKVRALLSDRYRPLENADLADAILPVLIEQQLAIVSCEITERRLYIKAFDKRIEREIALKGTDPAHTFIKDVVFPAITISNSEVGSGALSIAAGLYTGGCTNFAAFNDSRMRKYHTGGKLTDSEEVYALLSDKTKQLTDAAVWSQTRDIVKSAFEIARFEELVGRITETTKQKIEGDVVKSVELGSRTLGLTQGEGKSVLKHLIEGGDLSRYGLFNAVTRAAQDVEDYDRASEIERAGGRVIELSKNEWQQIALAA